MNAENARILSAERMHRIGADDYHIACGIFSVLIIDGCLQTALVNVNQLGFTVPVRLARLLVNKTDSCGYIFVILNCLLDDCHVNQSPPYVFASTAEKA